MKERKLKKIIVLATEIVIWTIIFVIILTNFEEESTIGIMCVIIAVLLMVIILLQITFWIDIPTEKNIKKEEQKKLRLIRKYSSYIAIIDEQINENFTNLGDISHLFYIVKDNDHIVSLDSKLNWVCKNRIDGKPDSFIIAACLMSSIIQNPRIKLKGPTSISEEDKFLFSVNLDIAIKCAFKVISEPITYYKNDKGKWIEEKHPKVEIVVPDGIIKNSTLFERIINAIYKDYQANQKTSIMQFSNLLHLIYLSCK